MSEKIKIVGTILLILFRLVVAYTLLLPALLVGALAILIIAFDFYAMLEFSNKSDLTYLLKGEAIKDSCELIKEALKGRIESEKRESKS